jgi:hypothetical protein
MRIMMRTIATLSVMGGVLFSGGIAPFVYFAVYLLSALNFYCLTQYQPGHLATAPTCRVLDSINGKITLQQLSQTRTNKH